MAKTNYYYYYYCSRCEETTRHIEIPYRELAAIKGENKLAQFIYAFNDYNGVAKLLDVLDYLRPYKCCKCGHVTDRNYAGEEKYYWNRKK